MKPKMLQWNEKFAYIFIDIIIIDYFAFIFFQPLVDLYIACLIHCSTQIRIKYHFFLLLLFLCHRNRDRCRRRYENECSKKEYSY